MVQNISINAAYCAIKMAKKEDGTQLIALTAIHIPLSSYGLIMSQDELKQPKEKRGNT